ncbi:MAG: alkaline phosphatase family protein [Steroidobacteraceae bacterium]|jgi:predicted AlkP superfamily phosphohydrolase/phosphomutase
MGGSSGGRTVVLGVDSLDLMLVERWAAQGVLPFFQSMLRDGSLVRLSGVTREMHGAVWPSLLGGRSLGHHGSFYLTQLTGGTYNLDRVEADQVPLDPYYGRLDANGVRCAIVDIPNDMPLKGFKGLHVVDWLTEFQTWRFTTQPASIKRQIEDGLGALNKAGGYGPTRDSLEGHRLLQRKLEKSIVMKSTFMKGLLERNDLDHIFVVFAEAHKAGHFLWKYTDPSHPDHVQDAYLRDSLLGIYRLLDKHLAELAGKLTHRDNLIIFSDQGMQANYRGDQFIGTILERLGLCGTERASRLEDVSTQSAGADNASHRARSALRALITRITPESIGRELRRWFGAAGRVDWSRTRVFSLPTNRNSFLRVNLRGREPEGIVARGKEYDDLLKFIEGEFRALVNAETGKPAVEAVFRIQELFPGERADDLPDIAILWHSDVPINAVQSPRLGRIDIPVREDRSGNHRSEGFLLARGPGIEPQVRDLHGDIMQIPGTMLALHGIPCPDYYEMPPLSDLLARDRTLQRSRAHAG